MLPELITSSYGKKYRDEIAVISLTSWKARINTVSKTIYNLFTVCPGFHICLVLSEDEFPQKEAELPKHLIMMANANMFEILWVKRNWKSFKKILFTMEKYRTLPIISADDDCIYKYNYAAELLYHLTPNTKTCVTYWCNKYKRNNIYNTSGYATAFSPDYFNRGVYLLNEEILQFHEDDMLYVALRYVFNIRGCVCLNRPMEDVASTHSEIQPLHDLYKNRSREERDETITQMIGIVSKSLQQFVSTTTL